MSAYDFTASPILGVIWGFWHLPLFYIGGLSQAYMSFALFLPLTLAFSIFFAWIYITGELEQDAKWQDLAPVYCREYGGDCESHCREL